MSTEISSLFVTIGANTQGFQNALKNIKPSLNQVAAGVAAISAAVVGFGIKATTDFVKAGDEVHKMALRTGFTTEMLSRLRYAAQIGGTSIQGLETGIKRMQRVLVDAGRGLETSKRALDDLGLSVDDLMAMNPEQQFMTILRAIAGVEDATLKAALAQDIFGRSGTDLLPVLEDGVEGLENTMDAADRLGVVFDEEAAKKAANLNDRMTDMKEAMNGVKNAIGEELAPVFIPLLQGMTDFIVKISEFLKEHPGFVKALMTIGTVLIGLIAAWKALSIAMAVAQAMSGPAGWTMLAIGAGVAIGAIAGINQMIKTPSGPIESEGTVHVAPWLAEGGIVRQPTYAVVGEAGPEAVIPLNKLNTGVNITVEQMVVREEADVNRVARELYNIQTRRSRYA